MQSVHLTIALERPFKQNNIDIFFLFLFIKELHSLMNITSLVTSLQKKYAVRIHYTCLCEYPKHMFLRRNRKKNGLYWQLY